MKRNGKPVRGSLRVDQWTPRAYGYRLKRGNKPFAVKDVDLIALHWAITVFAASRLGIYNTVGALSTTRATGLHLNESIIESSSITL